MRVLIVSMPWCAASRPNLSAGLLKSLAQEAGFSCTVLDAGLLLAADIGGASYQALAETPAFFGLCEHVFAADLFGAEALRSDGFLAECGVDGATAPFVHIRDTVVPRFLDGLCRRITADGYDLVGFTCTFNQVFASLALARRLKDAMPGITILLGGACVHGTMGEEYAHAFPAIVDHVFLGEADETFPAFLRAAASGGDLTAIPGITVAGRPTAPPAPMERMDRVSMPDYDDFFALRDGLVVGGVSLPDVDGIPFEGARGCWWGKKRHCVFCGLNNQGIAFRSKPPATVASEIGRLSKRHGVLRFLAADNIITHREFDALTTALTNLDGDYRIFYEIKANLKRDEVAKLWGSGIRWVQPGIESFSDGLLTLMRKGTTALQNVQLIRLCAEYGIHPSYNILVGFPGETAADYAEMLGIIGHIRHLPPPSGNPSLVQIHRFSPFHSRIGDFGFHNVRPMKYYRHVVPDGCADIGRIAYFFDRDMPPDSPYTRHGPELTDAVARWRAEPGSAAVRLGPGLAELEITAPGADTRTHLLDAAETALLILADRPVDSDSLVESAARRLARTPAQINGALARLTERHALLSNGGLTVSTIPYERPQSSAALAAWLKRWAPLRGSDTSGGGPAPP